MSSGQSSAARRSIRASRVPALASNPVWTMPLLALEAPSPTSGSRSTTTTSSTPRRTSSNAMAQPMTPPPMTTTSVRRLTARDRTRVPGRRDRPTDMAWWGGQEVTVKAGIVLNAGDPLAQMELAARAEAAGWDGVFTYDAIDIGGMDMYDPWTLLGGMALATSRVSLG